RCDCTECCVVFQAEDGIRARNVTGVQTCALPIYDRAQGKGYPVCKRISVSKRCYGKDYGKTDGGRMHAPLLCSGGRDRGRKKDEIGRASCREREHEGAEGRRVERKGNWIIR